MGATEIILLICGIVFLVLSFFVGNEKLSQRQEVTDADLFSAEKISEIKKNLEESIETVADDLLEETKNKLASASNETIISVDEFSRQTLERINHNHEEVVFMYNMLQTKEEELKKSLDEVKSSFDELEKKKEEVKNAVLISDLPGSSGIEMARKKSNTNSTGEKNTSNVKNSERKQTRTIAKRSTKELVKISDTEVPADSPAVDIADSGEDNKTSKILELYHKKKSVLEISKALGLGQGEVKLVIDLYGKN